MMGTHPITAALMGMISAVMGGVLRDTLTNETPIIFRPEIYASACLFGASVYIFADSLGAPQVVTFALGLVSVVSLRLAAIRYGLTLPKFFRK